MSQPTGVKWRDQLAMQCSSEIPEVRENARAILDELGHLERDARRWRFLEHGCDWVSWVAKGKDQVSYDPRSVSPHGLIGMRARVDRQSEEQVALLKAEAERLAGRLKA